MAEREEKWIILNKKKVDELYEIGDMSNNGFTQFLNLYEQRFGKKEYIAFNRDEPYADAIWDIIIAFETLKENIGMACHGSL